MYANARGKGYQGDLQEEKQQMPLDPKKIKPCKKGNGSWFWRRSNERSKRGSQVRIGRALRITMVSCTLEKLDGCVGHFVGGWELAGATTPDRTEEIVPPGAWISTTSGDSIGRGAGVGALHEGWTAHGLSRMTGKEKRIYNMTSQRKFHLFQGSGGANPKGEPRL